MGGWSRREIPGGGQAGAGAAGSRILYWTGGDGAGTEPSAAFWSYDTQAERWQRGPDLPLGVSRHACVLRGSELICIGGRSAHGPTGAVQVLHLPSGRWRMASPLPRPVWQHAAAAFGETVVCTGGIREGRTLDEVLAWDGSKWRQAAPLSIPRRGHGCLAAEGTLCCLGGSQTEQPRPIGQPERWNPLWGGWRTGEAAPSSAWRGSCAEAGGRIVFAAHGQRHLLHYSPKEQRWTRGLALYRPFRGDGVFKIGDRLYLADSGFLWSHSIYA